jgi:tRNA pseudouridine32 synthase/23S rRNA pseudouridine746 synthase
VCTKPSGIGRLCGLIVARMPRPDPAWTPPARDGVSASRLTVAPGPWATVAAFLAQRLRSGIDWPARMAQGGVLDVHGQPLAPEAPCATGQVLWYWRSLPPEPRVPFELTLLHCDEHLVVVDKPHFLAAVPGGRFLQETALVRLKRLLGNDQLVPVHRLDRETAGVLLFSAQAPTRDAYHALLRERQVHKVYEAVAPWRPDLPLPLTARHRLLDARGARHLPVQVIDGEPNAQTQIELLRRLGPRRGPGGSVQAPAQALAHYRLTPLTGRRHQLRVQLAALGLPIVGDRIYPRLWPEPAADAAPDYSDPLQLLAREIAFTDPVSGAARRFVSGRRLALADGDIGPPIDNGID